MGIKRQMDSTKVEMDKLEKDAVKFDMGNNAAGTRVRVGIQAIKRRLDQTRRDILDRQKQ